MNPQELTDKELNALINVIFLTLSMKGLPNATDSMRKRVLNFSRAKKEEAIQNLFEAVGITPDTTIEEMEQLEKQLQGTNNNAADTFTALFSAMAY